MYIKILKVEKLAESAFPNFAEKMRKFWQQHFATKVRKSFKSLKNQEHFSQKV